MAVILPSLVKFETTTTGTVPLSEGSAVSGFRNLTAAGAASTQQTTLRVQNSGATEWEEGIYTYTAGTPATLARTVILRSSNGGAAVNFSAGVKTCSVVDLGVFHGVHDGELHSALAVTSGAALTANLFPAPFALRDYMRCTIKLDADIPASATFNPNGLGAEPIMEMRPSGLAAVAAARFKAGMALRLQRIGSQWQITNGMVSDVVPEASDTVKGIAEKATLAEALAGSDGDRFVTPAHLGAYTKQGGSNLADGGAITIPATGGTYFVLDGTTALTTVAIEGGNGARVGGTRILLRFAAAKTVVHSSSLNLVGDVNLAAVAGDILELVYEGSGVWREAGFHAAALPEPPPPDGWEDLGETVLTAASEFVMSGLDADIRHLRAIVDLVPSVNATFRLQTYGADNVLDTGGSDYSWELWRRDSVIIDSVSTDIVAPLGGTAASIPISLEMDSADTRGEGFDGEFTIYNLPAALVSNVDGQGAGVIPGGAFRRFTFSGSRAAKEAVKGFKLFPNTGTMTGRVRVLVMRD